MKSKEDVLKAHVSIGRPDHAGMRNVSTECDNILDAMDEYAKQEITPISLIIVKGFAADKKVVGAYLELYLKKFPKGMYAELFNDLLNDTNHACMDDKKYDTERKSARIF